MVSGLFEFVARDKSSGVGGIMVSDLNGDYASSPVPTWITALDSDPTPIALAPILGENLWIMVRDSSGELVADQSLDGYSWSQIGVIGYSSTSAQVLFRSYYGRLVIDNINVPSPVLGLPVKQYVGGIGIHSL